MNQNAATAQAIRRSKSVIVSEGEPGGPDDDRKREACGHHQDRRSLHSVQKSHGDVEQPEASDPPADLNLGRATKQRAVQGCGVHGPMPQVGARNR